MFSGSKLFILLNSDATNSVSCGPVVGLISDKAFSSCAVIPPSETPFWYSFIKLYTCLPFSNPIFAKPSGLNTFSTIKSPILVNKLSSNLINPFWTESLYTDKNSLSNWSLVYPLSVNSFTTTSVCSWPIVLLKSFITLDKLLPTYFCNIPCTTSWAPTLMFPVFAAISSLINILLPKTNPPKSLICFFWFAV